MGNAYLYRFIASPRSEAYGESLRLLVQHNRVKLSLPSLLNDPFDCKTLFSVTDASTEDLRAFIESTLGKDDDPEASARIEAAMRAAALDPDRAIEALRRCYSAFHSTMLDEHGILCFFQPLPDQYPKDILMWAHYANGHRGLCFQFRKSVLLENFACRGIQYIDRYPTLKEVAASGEGERLAELFLFRKSTRWSYENEWALAPQANGRRAPSASLRCSLRGDIWLRC